MFDNDFSEHYIRRGDPSKPTYYIIRREYSDTGLFARYKIIGEHIRYALTNGWLPVVDMQNYPNAYLAPEKLGKENAWEYYFEQPLRIGLEEAYRGENIILSAEEVEPRLWESMALLENCNNVLTEWRMLRKFGLLKVKDSLMAEIAAVREKLFAPNDRLLGVHLRGTDYTGLKPFGHCIQPPVEHAINTVYKKLQEWHCNKIFLATEDENIVQIFKQVFGDTCVTFDREYVNYEQGQYVGSMRIDRPNDHFLQGKEYLTEMVLLSMCNSFVAARCSGTVGVMMLADNFEHTYFFDLGRYDVADLENLG